MGAWVSVAGVVLNISCGVVGLASGCVYEVRVLRGLAGLLSRYWDLVSVELGCHIPFGAAHELRCDRAIRDVQSRAGEWGMLAGDARDESGSLGVS